MTDLWAWYKEWRTWRRNRPKYSNFGYTDQATFLKVLMIWRGNRPTLSRVRAIRYVQQNRRYIDG